MTVLDLKGNSIDDNGVLDLCDSFLNSHVSKLRVLNLSETGVTDRGVKAVIESMQFITTLSMVLIEKQKEVSKEVKAQLEAAMRKNKLQTDEMDKLRDMDRVATKIQKYKD